jgi:hypothetical protein
MAANDRRRQLGGVTIPRPGSQEGELPDIQIDDDGHWPPSTPDPPGGWTARLIMEAMMERVSVEHDRSGTRVRLAGDVGAGRLR